ncbi:MAG: hypothetical protein IJ412_08505 [Oscillospiraceae bacterium]|nr:hypothetical protein [Oscillospiraceae bacterium]
MEEFGREDLLAWAKEPDLEEAWQSCKYAVQEDMRLPLMEVLYELLDATKERDEIIDYAERIMLLCETPEEFERARAAKNAETAKYGTINGTFGTELALMRKAIMEMPPMPSKPGGLKKLFGGGKEYDAAVASKHRLLEKRNVLEKYTKDCAKKLAELGASAEELAYYESAERALDQMFNDLMSKK